MRELSIEDCVNSAILLSENAQFIDHTQSYDIASGHAGYSLMFTHLARVMTRKQISSQSVATIVERSNYHLLESAKAWRRSDFKSTGLFDGIAGYIFALHSFDKLTGKSDGRSARMASALREEIFRSLNTENNTLTFIQPLYDVISGLAGTLSICQYVAPANNSASFDYLYRTCISSFTTPEESFFYIRDNFPSQELAAEHPEGYIDFGVAHGITGIIPRLINSTNFSTNPCSTTKNFDLLINWIVKNSLSTARSGVWSSSEDTQQTNEASSIEYRWCYGSLAQLASILTLEPKLLGESNINKINKQVNRILLPENIEAIGQFASKISSFGLCHGLSGFLLTVDFLLNKDTKMSKAQRQQITRIIHRLSNHLDLTGQYNDLFNGNSLHSGLLNGGVGVLLTKLSVSDEACKQNKDELNALFFGSFNGEKYL